MGETVMRTWSELQAEVGGSQYWIQDWSKTR